ncbi:MAG: ABC transporter ATP-binding protein, partial [Proteobacteria bacterium]|nr:ABC transporter ATP-binding protein [Pseudomonadota bacterium]
EKISSNKTIVLVSHQAAMIKKLCNRVVWIEEGVTKAEGEPNEVIKEYNQFLAVK